MDPSTLIRKLEDGDMSNIVREVENALAGPGRSSLALRVLPRVSNMCLKRNESVMSDDNAMQLVLSCFQAIERDSKTDTNICSNGRTIVSVLYILFEFKDSGNLNCFVKTLNAVIPTIKKMLPSVTQQEHIYLYKYVRITHDVLLAASNGLFTDNMNSSFCPLDLWDLMLKVSTLVSPDKSYSLIFHFMRRFSMNYENTHGSSAAHKVVTFNKVLLGKFCSFFEAYPSKLIAEEGNVNAFFSMLVPALWQFLGADLASGSISNLHQTVLCLSKFVKSFLSLHFYHVKCFELITKMLETLFFKDPLNENLFVNELNYLTRFLEENSREDPSPAFSWVLYIGGCAVGNLEKLTAGLPKMTSFFTLTVLNSMQQFVNVLLQLLLSCNSVECQDASGQVCPYKGDANLAFGAMCTFLKLYLKVIVEGKEGQVSLLPLIQGMVKSHQTIVDKAVDGKCVRTVQLKEKISDFYFKVGCTFYDSSHWEYGRIFLEVSLKYLNTSEKDFSSIQQHRILSLLPRLSVCYENQKLTQEAKVSVLLHAILSLKWRTPQLPFISHRWALLQNTGSTEAKPVDVFLKTVSPLLKSMCPELVCSAELVPDLLLWELSCYTVYRMQSYDMILNTWRALEASKPSALTLLEGSVLAEEAFFLSFNGAKNVHKLMSESVPSLLSQVVDSENAASYCIIAAHYYLKFLVMAQSHFDENQSKVEESSIYSVNPSTVRQPKDVINPSDVCEVRSTFPNLNVIREQKLMELLDTALNYWNDSLDAGLSTEHHIKHSLVAASGENLLLSGFLYSLWGNHSSAANAFQVCCKFARKMSLNDLLLKALSGLMNVVEVKQNDITEADKLLETLKSHPKISYLTQFYHTSRIFQALRKSAYSEGVELLRDVVKFTPTTSSVWCYAYGKLLQAAYSVLPKSKLDKPQLGGSLSAQHGLLYCIKNIKGKRLANFPMVFVATVDQALRASLWIGRYYLQRQMPRQARSFLKSELIMALKLGLATRAAEFICELAFVDLITEKVDEARAKIVDLQCILINSGKYTENNATEDDAEGDVDDIALIDEPCRKPEFLGNNLGASPNLRNEEFHLPIAAHNSLCNCYLCRNCLLQIIWLMYSHLQAKTNFLHFDVHKSNEIYKKAFKAAKGFLSKLSQPSGFLLQQHQLACKKICLTLDFIDMLVVYKKDTEALKHNSDVFRALKHLRTDENLLFVEALEQKMCILNAMQQSRNEATDRLADTFMVGNACASETFVEKTPEKSTCIHTPLLTRKKRQPLKLVKTPNQIAVSLTGQQFFTPKVTIGNASDEEKTPQVSNLTVQKKYFKIQTDQCNIYDETSKVLQEREGRGGSDRQAVASTLSKSTKRTKAGISAKAASIATQEARSTRKDIIAKEKSNDLAVFSENTTTTGSEPYSYKDSNHKPVDPVETGSTKNAAHSASSDEYVISKKTTNRSKAVANPNQCTLRRITRSTNTSSKVKSELKSGVKGTGEATALKICKSTKVCSDASEKVTRETQQRRK